MSQDQPKKRGPGRPKKIVAKKVVPKKGIVQEPRRQNDNPQFQNVMEVYYDQPLVMKKIFNLFKAEASKEINLSFRKDRVLFIAQDHKQKSYILAVILGAKINGYYIEEPFDIRLKTVDIQKAMNTINKDYVTILIWINRIEKDQKIHFTLHNDKYEDDTDHEVETYAPVKFSDNIDELLAKEPDYPINFEMDSKYFKKKIVDASALADTMRIEKDGDQPLTLSYPYSSKGGRCRNPFNNSKKFHLVSKLGDDDYFRTSFYLAHVNPLAKALIADQIQISAHQSERLIFTAYLDREVVSKKQQPGTESCTVKVLTEVINRRI